MIALANLTVLFAVLVTVAVIACVIGTVRDRQRDRRRNTSVRITEWRRVWFDAEAARSDVPFYERTHVDARHGWRDLDEAWKTAGLSDGQRAAMGDAYHAHPSNRSAS